MNTNGLLDPLHLARPNPARMYDYCLGQYHNFPLDRRAVETLDTVFLTIRIVAQANAVFVQRARQFVRDALDITQMLDIGCGMYVDSPFQRTVSVDHDPIVFSFNSQLTSCDPDQTMLLADLRAPEAILAADAVQLLDWTQPIALVLGDVLPYVSDDANALASVQHLVAALPEGSALILSHPWREGQEELADAVTATYATWDIPYIWRTFAQMTAYTAGLALLAPGIVDVARWNAARGQVHGATPTPPQQPAAMLGLVAYRGDLSEVGGWDDAWD